MLDFMSSPWDRLAARVKRAGRSEDQPDEHGYRAVARLDELVRLSAAVNQEIDREIIHAREQGAQWQLLGGVLGMSKQGAQHRYRIAMTNTGGAVNRGWTARTMRDLEVKQD